MAISPPPSPPSNWALSTIFPSPQMPTMSSMRCWPPVPTSPSRRKTRCRPIACAGNTSSASMNCATAMSRRPRAGSTCTAVPCSASWPSARHAELVGSKQRLEATKDHSAHVIGHLHRAHLGALNHLLLNRLARRLVGILDPGKDDRFVSLRCDGSTKISDLAVRHIVLPGLHNAGGAPLEEHLCACTGGPQIRLSVGLGHGCHESIDIRHFAISLCWLAFWGHHGGPVSTTTKQSGLFRLTSDTIRSLP